MTIRQTANSRNCRPGFGSRAMPLLPLLLAVVTLAGCGDGLDRVQMSGKVTYAGQPVEDGQIRFVPAPGTEMPLTVETIKNGRYETSTSGGVPTGSYKVVISSYHPDDPVPTGPGAPQRRQFLPPKYNTRSELKITIDPGQKRLEHNFELSQ